MTYSDVIILRLTQLCEERKITINKLPYPVLHSLLWKISCLERQKIPN